MKKTTIGLVAVFTVLALAFAAAPGYRVHADNGNDNGNGGDHGNGAASGDLTTLPSAASPVAVAATSMEGEGAQSQSSQESLSLNPSGHFTLTGASVVSVDASANTITATLYGITKTVSVGGAAITGGNGTIALGAIQAGDTISATGQWSESSHTATVATVNDVSYAQKNQAGIQAQIASMMQLLQQLQARLAAMQSASSTTSN